MICFVNAYYNIIMICFVFVQSRIG